MNDDDDYHNRNDNLPFDKASCPDEFTRGGSNPPLIEGYTLGNGVNSIWEHLNDWALPLGFKFKFKKSRPKRDNKQVGFFECCHKETGCEYRLNVWRHPDPLIYNINVTYPTIRTSCPSTIATR